MTSEEIMIVSEVQESLCRVFCTTLPMGPGVSSTRHTHACSELTRAIEADEHDRSHPRKNEDLAEALDVIQKIRAKTPSSLLDADINFEIRKVMIKHRIPV